LFAPNPKHIAGVENRYARVGPETEGFLDDGFFSSIFVSLCDNYTVPADLVLFERGEADVDPISAQPVIA
jgi:hypothetical protein